MVINLRIMKVFVIEARIEYGENFIMFIMKN